MVELHVEDRTLEREQIKSVRKVNLNDNQIGSLGSVGAVFPELEYLAISSAFLIQIGIGSRRSKEATLRG